MRIEPGCEECLYLRQVHTSLQIQDEEQQKRYLADVKRLLEEREEDDSAPYLVYLFTKLQETYGIDARIFPKEKYNQMIMSRENELREKIERSAEPLASAIVFARVGNYIDFGAMDDVNDDILLKLIEEANRTPLDQKTYELFLEKCAQAKTFLLLCDNCGEIVLDKLFIEQLKYRFPHLQVSVMVRGANVLNDATLEDAAFCGMNQVASVVSNGTAVAGTVYKYLSEEAREVFDAADIILSKGQGNYESLAGVEKEIFYSFLCKCELFTERFQVPKLTGMFVYGRSDTK